MNKVRILFIAADPTDAVRLRLGQELRDIRIKLQLSKLRDFFVLESRESTRPDDITQAIFDIKPQIIHFSGHGLKTGELCFEDDSGKTQSVQPDVLENLFKLFSKQVKCVILNACYSEIQAKSIAKQIPFVIGMQQAIEDKVAIAFSVGFYKALGAGRDLEDAYDFACLEIRLRGLSGHLNPVLHKKKGFALEDLSTALEKTDRMSDFFDLLFKKSKKQKILDPYSETNFSASPYQKDLLISILKDLKRHFQHSQNPLLNSYHQEKATRKCTENLPSNRMMTLSIPLYPLGKPWAPELLWAGEVDYESIKRLQNYTSKLQISVHSMMVSTIAASLELSSIRGIKTVLSCPSSTSARHILSLLNGNTPCDIFVTADAGVYLATSNITKLFRRVLTLWEEEQLVIGNNRDTEIGQVLVAPGTTQEVHYRIGVDEGNLPKEDFEEVRIENLFVRARELSADQAILLTYPKAQPILKELDFFELTPRETRGMTFGLYMRRDLPESLQVAFLRSFIFAYNRCKQRFENQGPNGIRYRRNLLRKMAKVPGFLRNYKFGTFGSYTGA
ncbi:CHAT domain-containing protein [Leptothoe sp. PORK10 BA2]|uniref:CHAT domain-containing protein n=1 Tax=Leptothoe sp. PORK10 BA2 TaxID=3110254 RepID=UPI002B1EFEE2|nr:CHAT domain-containing protein [Leptothoe sp. PORK10 BA2]MEA5466787.1 CHAT domain-containing protein [Leptothoe sp. PORK10 BA2]